MTKQKLLIAIQALSLAVAICTVGVLFGGHVKLVFHDHDTGVVIGDLIIPFFFGIVGGGGGMAYWFWRN